MITGWSFSFPFNHRLALRITTLHNIPIFNWVSYIVKVRNSSDSITFCKVKHRNMKKIFALFAFFKTEPIFGILILGGVLELIFIATNFPPRIHHSGQPQSVVKLNGFEQVWMKSNVDTSMIGYRENNMLIADSGRIFVPIYDNDFNGVQRIDILNSLDGKKIGSTPSIVHLDSYAVEGSLIYWGSREDCIKYDLEKKKRLWKKNFPKIKWARNLQIVNGELQFYGVYPSRLYRISSIDGSEIQIVDEQIDINDNSYRYENGIYYGGHGYSLQAIDKNKKIIWKTDKIVFGIDGYPVVSKGIIYGIFEGKLYAFDRQTGKTLFRTNDKISITSNIVEGNQRVFFITADKHLYAVSTKNANVLASIQFLPNDDLEDSMQKSGLHYVAYDPELHMVFVLFVESKQLFAFKEIE